MKKILCLVAMLVLISGCATMQKDNTVYQDTLKNDYKNYEVEIMSEPSGAKIEINGDYIGTTPLRYVFNGSVGLLASVEIIAYPISAGQQVQRKYYSLGDIIPRRIYFNMDLVSVPRPVINVNINE